MENDTIGNNSDDFQTYYSKKRKNKNKRMIIQPIIVNPDYSVYEQNKDVVESSSELCENSDEDKSEEGSNVRIVNNDSVNLARDAMLSQLPTLLIPEETGETEEVNKQIEENDILSTAEHETHFQNNGYKESINTRALPKYAATYELEKFEKKALLIFNQENIEGYIKPRFGTEKDVEVMRNTFDNLGFDVVEYKDLTRDEILKELKTFSEADFTNYGCVAVAVLTHGTKNGLLRARDQLYSEAEILNYFKVHDKPTLVTKPRVLIIQACRGTKSTQGVAVLHAGKIRKDLDEEPEPYYLPVESDMLVLHSSYNGNPSFRHEVEGSWFIQTLCSKIDALAVTMDLESILTEVKREVAVDSYHEEYNRRTFEVDINKQMPVVTSTLIRKLYLKRFGGTGSFHVATKDNHSGYRRSSTQDVSDSMKPSTPLQLSFGPCRCFLDHFSYIKSCLRHFLEDNPQDMTAQGFLEVADSFEDGAEFNSTKEKMLKVICNHLMNNCKDFEFHKYLHFYRN